MHLKDYLRSASKLKKEAEEEEKETQSQTVNRTRDFPLTVHFLYQCHMCYIKAPPLLQTRCSFESIHSLKRTRSQIATNSFAPLSPRYVLGPFFTRHISSEHSDTKMSFFRHTNPEKIKFV